MRKLKNYNLELALLIMIQNDEPLMIQIMQNIMGIIKEVMARIDRLKARNPGQCHREPTNRTERPKDSYL